MSPRRNRPHGTRGGGAGGRDAADRLWGLERRDSFRGEDWLVRQAGGGSAGKRYRCPGCDQEIALGVPHLVVWPESGGVDDRRHWHTACWNARERRGAKVQRSRNAPRY